MANKHLFQNIILLIAAATLLSSCATKPVDEVPSTVLDNSHTLRLSLTSGNPELLNAVLEEYGNRPENVKITVNKPSENDDYGWLLSVSDLLILSSTPSKELLAGLTDLEPSINSTSQLANQPLSAALEGCELDGRQYGLPLAVRPVLLYMNTAKVKEYGLSQLSADATITELKAAIDAIAGNPSRGSSIGFLESPSRPLLKSLVSHAYESNKDVEMLKADLAWYVDSVRLGVIATASAQNYQEEWTNRLQQGMVAYWFAPFSSLIETGNNYPFSVSAIPVSREFQMPGQPICLAINQTTQPNSSAWDFAMYLFDHYPTDLIDEGLVTNLFLTTNPNSPESISASDLSMAVRNSSYKEVAYEYSTFISLVDNAVNGDNLIETSISESSIFESLVMSAPMTEPPEANAVVTIPPPILPTSNPAANAEISAFVDPVYLNNFPGLRTITEAYNQQHPSTTINLQQDRIGFSSGYSTLFDAENYDCFAAPAAVVQSLIDDESIANQFPDLILPLDPLLDSSPELKLGNDPNILDSVTLDGKVMGYPISIIPNLIYYNKTDLLNQGIEVPGLDWDLVDFWEIMNQVADKDRARYGYVPLMTDPASFFNDASYLSETEDGISANYASSEIRTLLETLRSDANSGVIFPYNEGGTDPLVGNYSQRDGLISQGRILFWFATPYSVKYKPISPETGEKAEVGLLPLPGNQTYNASEVIALFISINAKNPQGCWDWFNYIAQSESYLFEGIPLNPSILASTAWQRSVGEEKASVYRFLSENLTFEEIQVVPYSPFRQWWNDLVYAAYSNQDLNSTIALVQDKASNTLQCIRDLNPDIKLVMNLFGREVDECAKRFDPSLNR